MREMQLLEAHRAGDPDALSELLQGYQHRIYAVCYRMLGDREQAADLAQDAMVKVIEGLDSYSGQAKLSTWIIRITMNACLSHLRKQKLRRHASLDDTSPGVGGEEGEPGRAGTSVLEGGEPSAEQRVQQAETRSEVAAALDALDPDVRALLVLRDLQGLEYEQIGTVLDIPLGTVKSRLFRARAALRETIESRADHDWT